jgi:hypothetical protein
VGQEEVKQGKSESEAVVLLMDRKLEWLQQKQMRLGGWLMIPWVLYMICEDQKEVARPEG